MNALALPQRGRAAVFVAAGQPLAMREFDLPALAAGEALVRVECCTICGSDVHTYQGHRATPTPTVLGHEVLGRVVALGTDPPRDLAGAPLALGSRISWSVAAHCGQCFYCRHDLPQKCERLFKYGHECCAGAHPLSGGLAEFCHLAAGTPIVQVPAELPDEVACPLNCATATVAAALRLAGPCAERVVLVQGAGMLGLTAAAMARFAGAAQVLVSDVDAQRLAAAPRFGATGTILAGTMPDAVLQAVEQPTSGRGADIALEFSGSTAAMTSGLAALRIGGCFVWAGAVRPTPPVAIDPEQIVRRMLTIRGIHNYAPCDLAAALAFLAASHQHYPFAELVAGSFPLAEADAAFRHTIAHRAIRVAVRG